MELVDSSPASAVFLKAVASALERAGQKFTLIDIGCSGGIDGVWRAFEPALRSIGIDSNVNEIARLSANEVNPEISYVAAIVGLRPDDPFSQRFRAGHFWDHNPWGRLSVAETLRIRSEKQTSDAEKLLANQWQDLPRADPAKPLVLLDFLQERRIADIDFIKIDVDGPDYLILRSIEPILPEVCGVGIEVNFFGSDNPEVHSFHNVDRFMRKAGFELFGLTLRKYSSAGLPAPYAYGVPAQSTSGRPLQGDAVYLRDTGLEDCPVNQKIGTDAAKITKLSGLYSVFSLPDMAAETLLRHRNVLKEFLDLDSCLDMLTGQISSGGRGGITYKQWMSEFRSDSPYFYGGGRS